MAPGPGDLANSVTGAAKRGVGEVMPEYLQCGIQAEHHAMSVKRSVYIVSRHNMDKQVGGT